LSLRGLQGGNFEKIPWRRDRAVARGAALVHVTNGLIRGFANRIRTCMAATGLRTWSGYADWGNRGTIDDILCRFS